MFRSNRNYQLINYFYYIKFASKKDNTFFRHININVLRYLKSDRKKNIIQKLIFLNDEIENDCTMMIKEFHKNF